MVHYAAGFWGCAQNLSSHERVGEGEGEKADQVIVLGCIPHQVCEITHDSLELYIRPSSLARRNPMKPRWETG